MPRKFNYRKKKTFKKKRFYRKKKWNNKLYENVSCIGIPDKMKVRLRSTYRSAEITTGTFAYTNIYINSAYNPMHSLLSTQPMYYDQFAALYGGYKVVYAKVKFTIFNTSNSEPIDFVLLPSNVSGSWSTMYQMREQKNAYHTVIGAGDGSKDLKVIRGAYRMSNLVSNYNDQAYGALNTTSNPPNIIYLNYGYQNIDGSTAISFIYDIEMIQTIIFCNPTTVAQS